MSRTICSAALAVLLLALPAAGEEDVAALLEEAFANLASGDLDTAEPRVEQALELAEQGGDLRGQAQALLLTGLLQSRGDTAHEALASYQRSYDLLLESGDHFGAWLVLSARGEALRLLDRHDEARNVLEQAVGMLAELSRSGETVSLDSFRMFARSQGFPREVFDSVGPYLAVVQPLFLRMAEAMTLTRIAALDRDQGRHQEALTLLERAQKLSQPFGLMDGPILKDKAALKAQLGLLDEAAEDYAEALANARKLFDRTMQLKILTALAEVETQRDREDAALDVLNEALEIARQIGDREREAVTLNNLGWLHDRHRRYEEAQRYYNDAIAVARANEDRTNEATSMNNLAGVLISTGHLEEAVELLEESLGLAQELEDTEQVGVTLNTLSEACRLLGRREDAQRHLEQALEIAREIESSELEAAVHNNMSVLFTDRSAFREALPHHRRALEIAEARDDVRGQALALLNLASTYVYLGNLEEANQYFRKVLPLARQIADPLLEKMVQSRQAMIELWTDRPESARELLEASREVSRDLGDEVGELEAMIGVAMIDAVGGRAEEALPVLREAFERASAAGISEAQAGARLTLAIADLYLGQTSEAISELEAAMDIFEGAGGTYGKALAQGGVAVARYVEKDSEAAIEDLESTAEMLDGIQQAIGVRELTGSFAAQSPQFIYDALVYLTASENRTADAFAHAEKARARAFLQQIGNHPIQVGEGAPKKLLEQEQRLRQRMEALERQIADARIRWLEAGPSPLSDRLGNDLRKTRGEYRSLLLELAETHPETAALVRVDTVDLTEVRSEVLDEETTLIAYYVSGRQTLAWVVDRQTAELVKLELPAGELRRKVSHFVSALRVGQFDAGQAAELYRELVSPLLPYVRHRDWIMVPHGVLHSLPFAALWNSERERFLAEDYALTYVPSASVLRHLAAKRTPYEGRFLVLGDPDGTLPHAAAEAEAVARLHGARAWLSAEATEERLRREAGKVDVLHVAAHGAFDSDETVFSRVELSAGGGYDGHLEVHEIFGLDLAETDLVVLSACNTALGEQTRGDESTGLTRALLYAGSPAVITSLWPVADAASGALMESFYRNLRHTSDLAEALRRAQLEVMSRAEWRSPHFWAAFVLTGDPQALSGFSEETSSSSSTTAGEELAVLTSLSGKAGLRHRASSEAVPVRALQLVHDGDRLELALGTRAVLICRDDNLLHLKRSVVFHEDLCRLGVPLPEGSYDKVRPRGGRIQRLAGGFEPPPRDKPMEYGNVPVVLAPRLTALLESRPSLVWTEVPETVEYKVEWGGWNSTLVVSRRREDLSCRYDEMFDVGARVCTLPWPEELPALEPGAKYFLIVFARQEGELRERASGEENPINVLRPERAEQLRIVRDRLDALKLDDDPTREKLWAGFHLQDGVHSEAIAAYRRAVAAQPAAEVYNTLGDEYRAVRLYRFALESYRKALEISDGEETHAAARLGLGLVAYAWGEYREALEHAQASYETYSRLGLAEETAEARRVVEEARQRTSP